MKNEQISLFYTTLSRSFQKLTERKIINRLAESTGVQAGAALEPCNFLSALENPLATGSLLQ